LWLVRCEGNRAAALFFKYKFQGQDNSKWFVFARSKEARK